LSIFSNPAARSVEQAQAHTQAILELIGTRDPIEVLRLTPEALRQGIEGMPAAQLRRTVTGRRQTLLETG